MFLKYVQDSGHYLLMMFDCVGVHEDIVHVDHYIALVDEVFENVIHHRLEGGQAVGEAKEHEKGLEETPIHSEGGFPLVSLLDSYVVVSQHMSKFVKYLALESEIQLMMSSMRGSG